MRSTKFTASLLTACALALTTAAAPTLANDSEAEVAVGGLRLVPSLDVHMESEDLYISADEVRVKYVMRNDSDRDIEMLISFPLPSLPGDIEDYYMDSGVPDLDWLKFSTKVNGEDFPITLIKTAEVDGRDVGARIDALGWPRNWYDDYDFMAKLRGMSEAQRAPYVKEGLLRVEENGDVRPLWNIVPHVTRTQVFPANSKTVVEHKYAPLVGGSAGTGLGSGEDPLGPNEEGTNWYVDRYCVDQNVLGGFKKRMARNNGLEEMRWYPTETWLGYILKSGANWAGPIEDFRLVVDKGDIDNLVSFCMDGVTKIAPTQFEVRKTNFEPDQDLNILILKFNDMQAVD